MNESELNVLSKMVEESFSFTSNGYNLTGNAHFDYESGDIKDFNVQVNKESVYLGNANGWTDGVLKINTAGIPLDETAGVMTCVQAMVAALCE